MSDTMGTSSPNTVYNEGRVVGLSAYEIYVKHALSEGIKPGDLMTEREWLYHTLENGSSILVRLGPGERVYQYNPDTDVVFDQSTNLDNVRYQAIQLPQGSDLRAANTIYASLFTGVANFADDEPNFPISIEYPDFQSNDPFNQSLGRLNKLKSYLKIVAGRVIQPVDANSNEPDISKLPKLEFWTARSANIEDDEAPDEPIVLLLSGFSSKESLLSDYSSISEEPYYQNGDYLGPRKFPVISNIVFTPPLPSDILPSYMEISYHQNKPENGKGSVTLSDSTPFIDMPDVESVFEPGDLSSVSTYLSNLRCSSSNMAALKLVNKGNALGLYGANIPVPGDSQTTQAINFVPIDIQSPGTVKIFCDENNSYGNASRDNVYVRALRYKYALPHTVVIRRDDNYVLHQLSNEPTTDGAVKTYPIADVEVDSDAGSVTIKAGRRSVTLATGAKPVDVSNNGKVATVTTDGKSIHMLSMANTSGIRYNTTGSSSPLNIPITLSEIDDKGNSTYTGYITWDNLIDMLQNNKKGQFSLTIPKYSSPDPNSSNYIDLTPIFTNREHGSTPVEFRMSYGGNNKYVGLLPWDGKTTLANCSAQGFFIAKLKLYTTTAGTTSKFEIKIYAYLKNKHTIAISTADYSSSTDYFRGTGILWRGALNGTDTTRRPLFGTVDSPVSGGANPSTGVVDTWSKAPEGNVISADNMQLLADRSGWGWGVNLTVQGNGLVGNTGEVIRLIDRSYSYDGDAGSSVKNLYIHMGGNSSEQTAEWRQGVLPSSLDAVIDDTSGDFSWDCTCSGTYVMS